MLSDRITAAAELYEAGRVDKLLLSGDHGRVDYDEVGTMSASCSRAASRREDIFTDHAGFDTWDSAQRARARVRRATPPSSSPSASTWPARSTTPAAPA